MSLEGFVPALQALGNYEGKDYAVPSLNNTVALYYHKDMLEAAGVEPPTTWAELKDDAKKLTQGDTYGFVFPGINNEQGTFHTSPFIWSNGGNFETAELGRERRVAHLSCATSSTTGRSRSRW